MSPLLPGSVCGGNDSCVRRWQRRQIGPPMTQSGPGAQRAAGGACIMFLHERRPPGGSGRFSSGLLGPAAAAGPPSARWMVSASVREVTAGWPSRPLLAGGSGSCPLTAPDSSPWVTGPAFYPPLPHPLLIHPATLHHGKSWFAVESKTLALMKCE